MDRIVVNHSEIAGIGDLPADATPLQPKLPPAIHWSVKALLSLLVLVLPVLCLVAIILRVSLRNQSPRIRYAWTALLSTLLIISGFLTSAASVWMAFRGPLPMVVSSALDDLDQREKFPVLPSSDVMNSVVVSQEMKPMVVVVTPAQNNWFTKQPVPSRSFGAGVLLNANKEGYLFATARHVVEEARNGRQALVATASGVWSQAEIVARQQQLDLALLWVPRRNGKGSFTQPIGAAEDGEQVFVIGHPEGLKFSLSNGIVSRMDGDLVQISAPVSPGNSGGPVYDSHGNLIAVVSAKMDQSTDPNAENLNFAISSHALNDTSGWDFTGQGREQFQQFVNNNHANSTKTDH
jgi:S1-C subfamily serine protease